MYWLIGWSVLSTIGLILLCVLFFFMYNTLKELLAAVLDMKTDVTDVRGVLSDERRIRDKVAYARSIEGPASTPSTLPERTRRGRVVPDEQYRAERESRSYGVSGTLFEKQED